MPGATVDEGESEGSEAGPASARGAGAGDGLAGSLAGTAAFVATFAVGAALRLGEYLRGRSVWHDEAYLANNVVSRGFAGLLRPLDDNQGAPLGFLEVEKLATLLLGDNERALRLFPLLCSIAALPLFYRVGRRLGRSASTGLMTMALAALAPGLVYYAAEGKQYVVDAAVAVLLLDAALTALDREVTPRRAAGLALLGSACLWFSHPAVIMLAGVGTALIVALWAGGRRREAGLVAAAAAAWVGVFLVEYVVQLRALRRDEFLVEFWRRGYLAFPPRSVRDVSRYFHLGFDAFGVPFEDYTEDAISGRVGGLALAAWLAGLAALLAEGRRASAAMLAAPLLVTAALAMAGRYPLANRMILFLAATTLPPMAAALGAILRAPAPAAAWAGRALLLATALFLVEHDAREALKLRPGAGERAVLAAVARDWKDGDVLALHWSAEPPFRFYRRTGQVPGLDRVEPSPVGINETNAETVARPGGPLKGRPRVWVVSDRHRTVHAFVPQEIIYSALDASARRLGAIESGNCRAVLYDCR